MSLKKFHSFLSISACVWMVSIVGCDKEGEMKASSSCSMLTKSDQKVLLCTEYSESVEADESKCKAEGIFLGNPPLDVVAEFKQNPCPQNEKAKGCRINNEQMKSIMWTYLYPGQDADKTIKEWCSLFGSAGELIDP